MGFAGEHGRGMGGMGWACAEKGSAGFFWMGDIEAPAPAKNWTLRIYIIHRWGMVGVIIGSGRRVD